MKNWQINRRIFLIVAAISISFVWNTTGWSHGDETSIVPANPSAKAGDKLKVEVKGLMGLDLGSLTPLAVIVFNAIWGLTAAIWLRWTNNHS